VSKAFFVCQVHEINLYLNLSML